MCSFSFMTFMSFSRLNPLLVECGFNLHVKTKQGDYFYWGKKEGGAGIGARGFQVWDVLIHNRKKCSGAKTSTFLFPLHLKYKKKKKNEFPYLRRGSEVRAQVHISSIINIMAIFWHSHFM